MVKTQRQTQTRGRSSKPHQKNTSLQQSYIYYYERRPELYNRQSCRARFVMVKRK